MIFALAEQKEREGFTHFQPVAERVFEKIQEFAKRDTHALTGLATGFRDLDIITSGLQPSDLIIIAARPSMGKTALVLNIAQRSAVNEKAVVAIFSLEMSKEQLAMRMLSAQASIDARMLRTGSLTTRDWTRLAEGIGVLADTNLHIDDTPGITVLEMRAKLRRLAVEQKKVDLVIIDYLQLMGGGGRHGAGPERDRRQPERRLLLLARALLVALLVGLVALSLAETLARRLRTRELATDSLREAFS